MSLQAVASESGCHVGRWSPTRPDIYSELMGHELTAHHPFLSHKWDLDSGADMTGLNAHHEAVWSVIDDIAAARGISTSRLAIISGHDSTSFNKSKRRRGKLMRWPKMEVIASVVQAVGMSYAEFGELVDQKLSRPTP